MLHHWFRTEAFSQFQAYVCHQECPAWIGIWSVQDLMPTAEQSWAGGKLTVEVLFGLLLAPRIEWLQDPGDQIHSGFYVYITMENHHVFLGNSTINHHFSVAMLNYQWVSRFSVPYFDVPGCPPSFCSLQLCDQSFKLGTALLQGLKVAWSSACNQFQVDPCLDMYTMYTVPVSLRLYT